MLRPFLIASIELKRYFSDKAEMAFSIALPIVMFALMYGAFGGEPSVSITAHVVNLDDGPVSGELLQRLEAVEGVTVELHDSAEADSALDRSAILTAFVIPEGFSSDLRDGRPARIAMKRRGHGGDEGQIAAAIVSGVAQDIAGGLAVRNMALSVLGDSSDARRVDEAVSSLDGEPAVVVEERAGEESADPTVGIVAGVLTMFMMFAVSLNAQSLVVERTNGTLERLMTSRLSVNQLFAGKFLASSLRGAVQAFVLLLLGFAVMRIAGPGELVQALAYAVLFGAAVSAIGLVIAGLARTRDQAIWSAVFFTMLMTTFSGTFVPFESGPMEVISRFTLNRHAFEALRDILAGSGGLAEQGLGLAILGGVVVLGLGAARAVFRTY
jgi:ABC-2 type transport system permease protein